VTPLSDQVGVRSAHLLWVASLLALHAGTARADAAAAPVRIELRAEAVVTGPQVRLGDVAVIETLDLPMLERLVTLPLGPAPRTGAAVRLERGPLERWIRARTGLGPERIAWAGADSVGVRTAVVTVAGEAVAQRACEALDEAIRQRGLRGDHPAPAAPQDVDVPVGSVELRPRPVSQAAVLSRHPTVWVDLLVGGRFVRTVPVAFDLTVYGPAFVARDRRMPGDALGSAVEVREVPWSGLDVLPVDQDPARLQVRRPVEPGTTLTRDRVEAAPVVRRGSWVTLRLGGGLVSLQGRAEVLEDGRQGQAVHVRPPSSDGPILARVTGPGVVEVVP
jgi:flagella basal body P-ring formation protein FlgA